MTKAMNSTAPDRVERRHRRCAGQHQEGVEQEAGRETQRRRQCRVEGGELQLLVEQDDEQEIDQRHGAHRQERLRDPQAADRHRVQPDEADLAQEDGVLVDVDVARIEVEQQHADREQHREHDADRGVVLDAPRARQELGEEHGEQPRQGGAHDLYRPALLVGEQPDDDDAQHDRVADRVRQHAVAAQHEEGADQRRGRADQRAGQHDHQGRVVEQGLEHQASSRPSPARTRSASAMPPGVSSQWAVRSGRCATGRTSPRPWSLAMTARVPTP